MRVAVVGSREYSDLEAVDLILDSLPREDLVIVSGGAKGVDTRAYLWASLNDVESKVFFPDWNTHGKKAGFLRNMEIIQNCDRVIAFWDGSSKGTAHSIEYARKQGKDVELWLDGERP